ncbi:hypothetical protein IMCC14465_13150 [alpha proteobacterium IMCC14465]|uniref:Uncharacterized protein n=1 Tax=alpha proteobacterium IMCC14465 TaxID=1220535 RepID=J9E0U1_9PROT|nr:hypothetical protein IMCC14465_13150 [alpha proteobacterium IMCC14465]
MSGLKIAWIERCPNRLTLQAGWLHLAWGLQSYRDETALIV